ncbi:MAG: gamma-glutamylcyclotransferase [Rhodospirillaceae bacterium]|nr:gamma-glutamylcyclotransferase [Rhodospirillaceae bacterium]
MSQAPKVYPPVPASDPAIDPDNFWVFGYGSLMWRPGFDYVERGLALLNGFSRDMCLISIHYRGTKEKPGMVCGLSPGGACQGVAFRIAPEHVGRVVDYLDERELISYIYIPRHVPVVLDTGVTVIARAYVADAAHEQFAGGWSEEKKIAHVAQGVGSEGSSVDYLANIVAHLRELNISDPNLESLLEKVRGKIAG